MSERHYTREEAEQIFERATDPRHLPATRPGPGEGMTLGQLQEIGHELGIAPDRVAEAARQVDHPATPPVQRFLGLPLRVGHEAALGRPLGDAEWEQLVVDLRRTFDARGTVRVQGAFREWTNGNLQVLVEPAEGGHRIRMRTLNGNARALMTGGLAFMGFAGATLVTMGVMGTLGDPGGTSTVVLLMSLGIGMMGAGALPLPSWARRRLGQMEEVAGRLAAKVDGKKGPEGP